jgi:hypothetical protein
MDIGQHETEVIIVALIALTAAVITHSIDAQVYGSLVGALLGYSFHAITTSQTVAAVMGKK